MKIKSVRILEFLYKSLLLRRLLLIKTSKFRKGIRTKVANNGSKAIFISCFLFCFFAFKNFDTESNMLTLVQKDPVFEKIERIVEEKKKTNMLFQMMTAEKESDNIIAEKKYMILNSKFFLSDSYNDEEMEVELVSKSIVTKIEGFEYIAAGGETFSQIALNVNRSLAEIVAQNRQYSKNYTFNSGEKINISSKDVFVYQVNSGENLHTIADRYKISYEDLRTINGKYDQVVMVGEKIFIPYIFSNEKFSDPLDILPVSSPFGTRVHPVKQYELFHMGIDLAVIEGSNVYASKSGEVLVSEYQSGYGNVVKIEHENGYMTVYAHLSEKFVLAGDYVTEGQLIAASGNTGISTGPHLHFEIRKDNQPLNPACFLSRFKTRPHQDMAYALAKAKNDGFYGSGIAVKAVDKKKISEEIMIPKKLNYITSRM
jgi:murein DD-endopeptidase MepM/ murein hydrolase activator NlpD